METIRYGLKKTDWIRVAVSGKTIDGREITPEQIDQMAKNYSLQTYGARVNMEHIRGVTADSPFNMLGDVLALKAEDVTINGEKRRGLYAQLGVSEQLIEINKKAQKIYSSIEMIPNFAGTNEAYLIGLGVTDSPASLGTEALQFSRNFNIETFKSEALAGQLTFLNDEDDLDKDQQGDQQDDVAKGFLTSFVKNLFKKKSTFDKDDLENAFTEIAKEITDHDAQRSAEIMDIFEKIDLLEKQYTRLEEKMESYSRTPVNHFQQPKVSDPLGGYEKAKF